MHGTLELGKDFDNDGTYTEIVLKYDFTRAWSVFGSLKTYFLADGLLPQEMLRSIYGIGTTVYFGTVYVTLYHMCSHPTVNDVWSLTQLDKYLWGTSGTHLAIGIKF